VHGPIEAPPGNLTGCEHIKAMTRQTYCLMMQSLDLGIANVTAGYRELNIFDSTVWLFLADNGGMPKDGGFNYPLRGHKATVWEGGVRSQTFLHWTGFSAAVKGSEWAGLAHVTDWGVTLLSALGHQPVVDHGMSALDGLDLWSALVSGAASPRTEMLLSMRDADSCGGGLPSCTHRGELAYRKGPWKLIYGYPALRGAGGSECEWTSGKKGPTPNCWSGWSRPHDTGPMRPPIVEPPRPGQPPNMSLYTYGGVFLFSASLLRRTQRVLLFWLRAG
jgi:arylsulfatase B/arylsulfatase I/J